MPAESGPFCHSWRDFDDFRADLARCAKSAGLTRLRPFSGELVLFSPILRRILPKLARAFGRRVDYNVRRQRLRPQGRFGPPNNCVGAIPRLGNANPAPRWFDFRPHRRTSDVTFILARLVAHARATEEGLLTSKLDISKAFDSIDLDVVEAAATSFAGPAIARKLVCEHHKRVMELKIPGCSTTNRAQKNTSNSSGKRICTTDLHLDNERHSLGAVAPHWHIGAQRGRGVDGQPLMRLTWADDNMLMPKTRRA